MPALGKIEYAVVQGATVCLWDTQVTSCLAFRRAVLSAVNCAAAIACVKLIKEMQMVSIVLIIFCWACEPVEMYHFNNNKNDHGANIRHEITGNAFCRDLCKCPPLIGTDGVRPMHVRVSHRHRLQWTHRVMHHSDSLFGTCGIFFFRSRLMRGRT